MNPTQKRMIKLLKTVVEESRGGEQTLRPQTLAEIKQVLDETERCPECRALPNTPHKPDCATMRAYFARLWKPEA